MTPKEIAVLCAKANAAFKHLKEVGTLPAATKFEPWRKAECAVCGVPSLRAANHADFRTVAAHFEAMAPATIGRALDRHMEPAKQPSQKTALWKIQQACLESGLAWPGYPLSIASKQFKVKRLEDLSPKAAWALFYTMNPKSSKGRARPGKAAKPKAEPEDDNCPF